LSHSILKTKDLGLGAKKESRRLAQKRQTCGFAGPGAAAAVKTSVNGAVDKLFWLKYTCTDEVDFFGRARFAARLGAREGLG
jgi:hypothetical protein